MPDEHASGTPDESTPRSAAEGVPVPPPAPRDARPRPQYGEYAPDGWTWTPPPGETTSDPAPQMATPPAPRAPHAPSAHAAAAAAVRDQRPARPADRAVTVVLLVIGVLGAWLSVGVLQALPQSMQVLHTQEGLDSYTPGPEIPGLILIGSIVQVVIWVVAAAGSIALIRARRPSFWLPLSAGVLAAIALFVCTAIALSGDPALIDQLTTMRP
jgi:hypothetical protein